MQSALRHVGRPPMLQEMPSNIKRWATRGRFRLLHAFPFEHWRAINVPLLVLCVQVCIIHTHCSSVVFPTQAFMIQLWRRGGCRIKHIPFIRRALFFVQGGQTCRRIRKDRWFKGCKPFRQACGGSARAPLARNCRHVARNRFKRGPAPQKNGHWRRVSNTLLANVGRDTRDTSFSERTKPISILLKKRRVARVAA